MSNKVRVTRKTKRLLKVLLAMHDFREGPLTPRRDYGWSGTSYILMKEARLSPATYYPLMERLEANRWIRTEKEYIPESSARPSKIFCYLTDDGVRWARAAVAESEHESWWEKLWDAITGDD